MEGSDVMDLYVTIAQFPVCPSEVEVADLAPKSASSEPGLPDFQRSE